MGKIPAFCPIKFHKSYISPKSLFFFCTFQRSPPITPIGRKISELVTPHSFSFIIQETQTLQIVVLCSSALVTCVMRQVEASALFAEILSFWNLFCTSAFTVVSSCAVDRFRRTPFGVADLACTFASFDFFEIVFHIFLLQIISCCLRRACACALTSAITSSG